MAAKVVYPDISSPDLDEPKSVQASLFFLVFTKYVLFDLNACNPK